MVLQVFRDQPFFGKLLPVRWLRCLDAVFAHGDAVVTMERFTAEVTIVKFVTFEWVADSIPPHCQPERSLEPRRDSTNVLQVPQFGICGVLPRTKAVWVRDTEAPGHH